ncbi:MAG: ankyrin repeat domain-containing protein [Micavibrio sp.]|nr:ankyrin repeat domain-containing protein [Micavibrio sp.]
MSLFHTKQKFLRAVETGDTALMALYLKDDKPWLQITDRDGNSPLHVAVAAGNKESINFLLQRFKEFSRNAINHDGHTPLHIAAEKGFTDIARDMLATVPAYKAHITKADNNGDTPLKSAIRNGHTDVLKLFISSGKADLGGEQPAVHYAVRTGKRDSLRTLIEAGADINAAFLTPARYHSFLGFESEPARRQSPLMLAVQLNLTDITLDLLTVNAKHEPAETPLYTAAAHGNIDVASALLARGADINARADGGQTALHAAAQKGKADMVKFLLQHGANRGREDRESRTALSYAQQFAMKDIIDLLQDPPPALPPLKTEPVKKAEAPRMATPAAAPVALPVPANDTLKDADTWSKAGQHSVARVQTFATLQRRLTEIFNFETRERVTVSENLAARTEHTVPGESFDTISEDALARALEQFQRLGGKADEAHVMRGHITKMKFKS